MRVWLKISILSMVCFCFISSIGLAEDHFKDKKSSWVDRVHYGITVESDRSPTFYFDTIQPLLLSPEKDKVLFTQLRCSIRNSSGLYSIGLGYRFLPIESLLLGVNTFFDFQAKHNHYRCGIGIETFWNELEMRLNSYIGLSPKRVIGQTSTSRTYEQAVDGLDWEIGGMVPYFQWIKIYFGGYYYNYKYFKDMKGWRFRSEITPIKFVTLDFETYDDNKDSQGYKLEMRLGFNFGSFALQDLWSGFLNSLKPSKQRFPHVNLKDKILTPVRRNYNIQVEKWEETSKARLEIGGRW